MNATSLSAYLRPWSHLAAIAPIAAPTNGLLRNFTIAGCSANTSRKISRVIGKSSQFTNIICWHPICVMGRKPNWRSRRSLSPLFLSWLQNALATSSRSLGLIWGSHVAVLVPFARLGYGLDEKSDQTTGDVHHAMSAGQNHQSLRILAPASSIFKRLNITLSQVVHDLTFILFAAAHFMSLFATKFCLVLLQFGRIIYTKSVLIECHTKPAKSVFVRCIHQNCSWFGKFCETLVLEILLGALLHWDELEA